jgi:hypothetical protein
MNAKLLPDNMPLTPAAPLRTRGFATLVAAEIRAGWRLDEASCEALRAWSAKHAASTSAALLSAWQILLSRLTPERGFLSNVKVGGLSVNLSIDLAEAQTPRETLLRADSWLQHGVGTILAEAGSSDAEPKFTLTATESEDTLSGTLAYAPSCLPRDGADHYALLWCRLLNLIVTNDSMPWEELPLLSRADTVRLVHRWNDTDVGLPRGCFAEYFEEQV